MCPSAGRAPWRLRLAQPPALRIAACYALLDSLCADTNDTGRPARCCSFLMKVNLRLPQAVAQPTTLSLHLPLAYMHLQMERTEAELHGGRKGKVRDAKGESRGSRRKPGRFYGRTRQPQKRTAKGPRPERADSREERERSQERARVILTSRERPLGRSRKRRRRSPSGRSVASYRSFTIFSARRHCRRSTRAPRSAICA